MVGGQLVQASETQPGGRYGNVIFSPDGKHYAAIANGGGGAYVFADGKKQLVYQSIGLNGTGTAGYTADSSALVYLANNSGSVFEVVNGEESDALQMAQAPLFAPKGGHSLVLSYKEVLLDGKPLPLGDLTRANISAASFSPDGATRCVRRPEFPGSHAVPGWRPADRILGGQRRRSGQQRYARLYLESRQQSHRLHVQAK